MKSFAVSDSLRFCAEAADIVRQTKTAQVMVNCVRLFRMFSRSLSQIGPDEA